MPYIVVENFKGGLDSRRSSIVSAPGTMLKAENVHVTRGAELEKRKAFKTFASVPGSYGMEATSDGIVVFKSTNNEDSGCIEVYRECLGAIPESCGGWYPLESGSGTPIPGGYVIPEQFNDKSTGYACPIAPTAPRLPEFRSLRSMAERRLPSLRLRTATRSRSMTANTSLRS
jgi:hypothetical protein